MHASRRGFLLGMASTTMSGAAVLRDTAGVAAAAKHARPGDTLVLANGTWTDADLALEAQGSEGHPVTIRAETPGKVVFTGNSRLRFSGEWISIEGLQFRGCRGSKDLIEFRTSPAKLASHSRLHNCAVSDCSPADKAVNSRFVSLYGADNAVSRCYIAGKTNVGPSMVVWLGETPNRHRIVHNWWGPRPPLGQNGGESLRVGDSNTSMRDSLTLVEGNYFERCDGEVEIISNKSCGNIYRGNLFESCAGTLTLRHGNRCRVERNIFLGHGVKESGGIRIIGEEHVVESNYLEGLRGRGFRGAITVVNGLPDSPLNGYYQVRKAVIRNNIMVDCIEGLTVGVNGGNSKLVLTPEGVQADNNLVLTRPSAPPFDRTAAGPEWWPRATSSR